MNKYYFVFPAGSPKIVLSVDNVIQVKGEPFMGRKAYNRDVRDLYGPITNTDFLPELLNIYGGVL